MFRMFTVEPVRADHTSINDKYNIWAPTVSSTTVERKLMAPRCTSRLSAFYAVIITRKTNRILVDKRVLLLVISRVRHGYYTSQSKSF